MMMGGEVGEVGSGVVPDRRDRVRRQLDVCRLCVCDSHFNPVFTPSAPALVTQNE